MAELTEPGEIAHLGPVRNNENGNPLQILLCLIDSKGQDDGAPASRQNHTGYSISRQLFAKIEASMKLQVKKADSKWVEGVASNAFFRSSKVSAESLAQKRPEMAAIRRLMFEKNITTNYLLGVTWETPDSVWLALGYEPSNAGTTFNCSNGIIMFHEVSWKTLHWDCCQLLTF